MLELKTIAVIGAGNMGAKIAGLIATTMPVILFDIPNKEIKSNHTTERNKNIIDAIKSLKTLKPIAIWSEDFIKNIQPANLEDDLNLLKNCDLVIEAIIEDLDIKKTLYNKIAPYLKQTCVIASNTSTFRIEELQKDVNFKIRNNIIITHFFNPPLQMKLLELVVPNQFTADKLNIIQNFLTLNLGKVVVTCEDTPGFIGNRIGCFFMNCALFYADLYKVSYDIIDKIFIDIFNLPSTGIFGLYDLIGIDVVHFINKSLQKLPKEDRYHYFVSSKLEDMIEKNMLGRKTQSGFYLYSKISKKIWNGVEYVDLADHDNKDTSLPSLINSDDPVSLCIKMIITELVMYASGLIGQITQNPSDVDVVMKLGYGFNIGIFEFCTKIQGSFEWLQNFASIKGIPIPQYIDSSKFLELKKMSFDVSPLSTKLRTQSKSNYLIKSYTAADLYLLDKTDNDASHDVKSVLCFSFKTKMNTLNMDIFYALLDCIKYAEVNKLPLMIYNDFKYFSAGGDLRFFYHESLNKNYTSISDFIKLGQSVNLKIKYASVPIIACVRGLALGGGTELLLHAGCVITTPNLKAGLVESKIGLIPSWGGLKEILLNSNNNSIQSNILTLLEGHQSINAYDFIKKYSVRNFKIIMNDLQFLDFDLKVQDLQNHLLASNATDNKVTISTLNIDEILQYCKERHFDDHTKLIAKMICDLCGNEYNEIELLNAEHNIFMELIKTDAALQKISRIINK